MFVHGYSEGCHLLNETSVPSDNPDIDLLEGVYRCRDEMSDPRVTGTVDWTLDPYHVHYNTAPMTGRMEDSPVLTPDDGDGTCRGEGFGVDIWSGDGLSTVFSNESSAKVSTRGSSTTNGAPNTPGQTATRSSATSNPPTDTGTRQQSTNMAPFCVKRRS